MSAFTPKVIVLTGGPGAGKTSVISMLQSSYRNFVQTVPEAATILLDGGFPLPGRDIEWSLEWQAAFQAAIAPMQRSLEDAFLLKAVADGKRLLVTDRGILDGAAYTPGGQAEFAQIQGLDLDTVLARYHAVIHLESLATARSGEYGKEGNQQRFESLEEAKALEFQTRAAWTGHQNWRLIPSFERVEHKLDRVALIIDEFLEAA